MIIRVAHRARYTVLDNTPIDDPRLSFQALGLLAYLLSKPDHWEVSYRHLATVRTGTRGEGQHAVRQCLLELEGLGYLVRERRQDPTTRQWVWISTVYEVPLPEALLSTAPCGGFRGRESRAAVSAAAATAAHSKDPGANPEKQAPDDTERSQPVVQGGTPGTPRATRATLLAGVADARRAHLKGTSP